MIYNLAVKAMIGLLAFSTSCGPDVTVVKNCAGNVVDHILNGGDYQPEPARTQPPYTEHFTCAVEVSDAVNPVAWTTTFKSLDPKTASNGWGWYVACIISLPPGHHLPTTKQNGSPNWAVQTPMMECLVSTPPLFGFGTCRFTTGAATNRATFDHGYVAVGR